LWIRAAVKEATGWLAHAVRLDPRALTARGYRDLAIRHYAITPRSSIGQWPLALEESAPSD
jgi:hypothetical protein